MSQVIRVNKQDLYSIIESDYVPIFNPFTGYLNNLCKSATSVGENKSATSAQSAGSRDYILELAKTVRVKDGEADQHLWYLYLKKWLVAMVASWISDNVVNNANRMSKDDLLTLAQYALVCCEELEAQGCHKQKRYFSTTQRSLIYNYLGDP